MQRLHDAALRPGAVAAGAQILQVLLQRLQLGQPLADMRNVRFERGIGSGAVGFFGQVEVQQRAHFAQRHVHRPAQPDEAQLVNVAV